MGKCNCKVTQQIDYLHKKYGHNIPVSKAKKISFSFKEFCKTLLSSIIVILSLPIMLLHVLYVTFFKKDKAVSVAKLTKLAKVSK